MISDREAFNICIRGSADDLAKLLASGFSASTPSENFCGNTLIHLAAYNRDLNKLKLLVESVPPENRTAALNRCNRYNLTPLFETCLVPMSPGAFCEQHPEADAAAYARRFENIMKKSVDVADYLLQNNANPNTPRAKIGGDTPVKGKITALTLTEYINWQLSFRNHKNPAFEPLSQLKALIENQIALNQKRLAERGKKI